MSLLVDWVKVPLLLIFSYSFTFNQQEPTMCPVIRGEDFEMYSYKSICVYVGYNILHGEINEKKKKKLLLEGMLSQWEK